MAHKILLAFVKAKDGIRLDRESLHTPPNWTFHARFGSIRIGQRYI